MRIPKKVRICGQDFDIIQQDPVLYKGKEHLGMCLSDECKILIKKKMAREKKKEVFLHECLHAIDNNLFLALGEKKVNTLAIEILRFIRNNKIDLLS